MQDYISQEYATSNAPTLGNRKVTMIQEKRLNHSKLSHHAIFGNKHIQCIGIDDGLVTAERGLVYHSFLPQKPTLGERIQSPAVTLSDKDLSKLMKSSEKKLSK